MTPPEANEQFYMSETEFEALLAGQKTAQEALDAAVERGNTILRDFEDANS